jgi:hypothetical protein
MNGKIEKELDRVFSLYIRKKKSVDGYCNCIVCGAPYPPSQIDNGHCFKRGNHAVRWNENDCWPQCKNCNQYTNTDDQFKEALIKKIGIVKFEELERLSRTTCKMSDVDGREMISYFKKKIKRLELN